MSASSSIESSSPPRSPEHLSESSSSGEHTTEPVFEIAKMKGVVSTKLWGQLDEAEKQVIKEFGRDFPIKLNGKTIDESMLSEAEKTLIAQTEEGYKQTKLKGALIFNRFKAELEQIPMMNAAKMKAAVREGADLEIVREINKAAQKKSAHPEKAADIERSAQKKIERIEQLAQKKADRIERRIMKKMHFKNDVKMRVFNMMHQGLFADVNTKILSQGNKNQMEERGLLVGNTHEFTVAGTTYMARPQSKRIISVDTKSQTIVAAQIVYKREFNADGDEHLYSEDMPCVGSKYTYNYKTNKYVLEPISDPVTLQALHEELAAVPYS
jgi:hypothetical protein